MSVLDNESRSTVNPQCFNDIQELLEPKLFRAVEYFDLEREGISRPRAINQPKNDGHVHHEKARAPKMSLKVVKVPPMANHALAAGLPEFKNCQISIFSA